MAASEVSITIAQAKAIAEEWSRRKKNPVVIRQEGNKGEIVVWLPNYSGTKQAAQRISPDGKFKKA